MPQPTGSSTAASNATDTRQRHVIDTLRDYAVNGTLDPDRKYSEAALADHLGVSRTPIRHALAILIEEGVIQRAGVRGYVVRRYEAEDIAAAIEMRAAIEGLAARKAARTKLEAEISERFTTCLREGDALFDNRRQRTIDEARYAAMNATFHELVLEAAGTPLMNEVRSVLDRVPYGAPSSIRFNRMAPHYRAIHLHQAHLQHHYIFMCLKNGDGTRAEALFREHGELVKVSLGLSESPWGPAGGPSLPIGPPSASEPPLE